ncbi:MAG: PaaI family thioesterase [Pseudomonadota bacterium]
MKKLNPEYVKQVSRAANECPYFRLLSMRIVSLEIGSSVLEIDLDEKHLQPFGLVHGGAFSSIIDAATFWAVFPEVEENAGMTSVDLKLNYLASATSGKLIARGRRIKLGRRLGLGEAEVTDQAGRILAHGTSTLMVMRDLPMRFDGPAPRKYL